MLPRPYICLALVCLVLVACRDAPMGSRADSPSAAGVVSGRQQEANSVSRVPGAASDQATVLASVVLQAPVSGAGASAAQPTATLPATGSRFEQLRSQYPAVDGGTLTRSADGADHRKVAVVGSVVGVTPVVGERQRSGVVTLLQLDGQTSPPVLAAVLSEQPLDGVQAGIRLRVLGEASGRWPMQEPRSGQRINPPLVFVDAYQVGT